MDAFWQAPDDDLVPKLRWLIALRILLTGLLLGSTILLKLAESSDPFSQPLISLYLLASAILIMTVVYTAVLPYIKQAVLFAYSQIGLDTVFVTFTIMVTGSFSSPFAILYLLVIISGSMLLFRQGSLVMASLCSIQYGILVNLEYYRLFIPYGMEGSSVATDYPWSFVLYKVLMIIVGCFAVAFLSSFLTEQNRKTRRQLAAMENHVKRVEKMATVGEMAAGLAHEIKNPLAALKGSIQLLREEADYDPIRDRLMQIIVREADRLSSLVSSFLLFARPPMGRAEKIDLRQAMMEIVELFEKDSSSWERVTVEKSVPSDLWIEMDPQHLRQVLWNLLVNAGEAIEGSGRIIVDVSHERNRRIQIRITDNGCGMQPDEIKSIFDPFFTTKPTGTGLGLSIVHRILETYDSFLDVESRPGMGSTFTLNLRLAESPAS
ncbi:hypothetical protein D3OALGA1CA_3236 [Olavius algarvensis associated proteobacterium Delta 3]|nr:hypothetical protein D3OALGB2SA_1866 [Olavius algarvensis associated proteobacterium Delta 3]CAB5131154.1 hypothetical protein D3OALGA1CA_3236 [Olavius algarvensis associated proteobacterium Delta 3]